MNDPSFDPNAVDHHNDTLLHKFVREGKHDLLLVLLTESKGVRVNEKNSEDNSTPLHIAAAVSCVKKSKKLYYGIAICECLV